MHYIERDGVPVEEPDVLTWARWYETADRRVALAEVDDWKVSTVFLGINYRFSDIGAPLVYETMVFGGPLDQECERSETREDALRVHGQWVARATEVARNPR